MGRRRESRSNPRSERGLDRDRDRQARCRKRGYVCRKQAAWGRSFSAESLTYPRLGAGRCLWTSGLPRSAKTAGDDPTAVPTAFIGRRPKRRTDVPRARKYVRATRDVDPLSASVGSCRALGPVMAEGRSDVECRVMLAQASRRAGAGRTRTGLTAHIVPLMVNKPSVGADVSAEAARFCDLGEIVGELSKDGGVRPRG